jgi:hypothetical protein
MNVVLTTDSRTELARRFLTWRLALLPEPDQVVWHLENSGKFTV